MLRCFCLVKSVSFVAAFVAAAAAAAFVILSFPFGSIHPSNRRFFFLRNLHCKVLTSSQSISQSQMRHKLNWIFKMVFYYWVLWNVYGRKFQSARPPYCIMYVSKIVCCISPFNTQCQLKHPNSCSKAIFKRSLHTHDVLNEYLSWYWSYTHTCVI